MKIKTINYKRISNLGNYNSEHLEMVTELEEGEDPIEATQKLKETVLISLGLIKPSEENPDQDIDTIPF